MPLEIKLEGAYGGLSGELGDLLKAKRTLSPIEFISILLFLG